MADVSVAASQYYMEFNQEYGTTLATSSGLLTKEDVETVWFTSNRALGFNWWTATAGVSGEYQRVLHNGDVVSTSSENHSECVPYVWIN